MHEAGLDCGDDATRGLDALQFAPRLGRQLVGEVLDVPRAAGRVDDAGQVALQLQDGLGVAGDPPTERRAAFGDEDVVGQDGDGVGAAHAGGEARHGGTQGVHPRVVAGHHHPRAVGVVERRAVRRREPGDLADPRPQPAGGAELGDRLELVGGRGPSELELAACPVERYTGRDEGAHGVRRGGDVPGDLLRVGRAGVVPHGAVGDHDPGVRGAPGQLPDEGGRVGQAGVEVDGAAGAHPGADGVDAERPASLLGVDRRRSSQRSANARAAVSPTSSAGVDSETGARSRNTPSSASATTVASASAGSLDQDAGRPALELAACARSVDRRPRPLTDLPR